MLRSLAVVRSSFANQGQICLCGSRVFVERSAYKEFVERFIDKASQLRLGDPLDEKTEQGAIVNNAQLEKVKFYVDLAQKEGGQIAVGGSAPESINDRCRAGYFFQPTVITGLPVSCRTNREEIFGPVVTITPFDSEEEVIDYANDYRLRPRLERLDAKSQSRPSRRRTNLHRHSLGELLAGARPARARSAG